MDVVEWWKATAAFPIMRRLAQRYVWLPGSSADSERLFSCANMLLGKRRMSITPHNLEKYLKARLNQDTRAASPAFNMDGLETAREVEDKHFDFTPLRHDNWKPKLPPDEAVLREIARADTSGREPLVRNTSRA